MGLKKKISISLIGIGITILMPLVLFYILIPRADIANLSDHFVKVVNSKDVISYKIVKKMPARWVKISQIDHVAAHAIVVSEDWLFYNHQGYDLPQIKKAVFDSFKKGKKLRGASTISQQVIKNLFFQNDRSYWRKLKELAYTVYLEKNVSKEKILEVYLNIIEYGKNLYGIKAAARFYFKKNTINLSARDGAFLAMLLPNPVKYGQSFRDKKLTKYAQETVDNILKNMVKAKYIKKEKLGPIIRKTFQWEKGHRVSRLIKQRSKKRQKKNAGKINPDEVYRSGEVIEVNDDPTFDEDAIMEDASGVDEEFSLE